MRKSIKITVVRLHLLLLIPTLFANANDLAKMSGILRTYQVSACDNEMLTVECDSRTVVSIVVGYYGKPTPPRFTCRSHFVQRSNKLTNGSSPIVPPLPLVNHSSIDAVENNIITPSNHCPNVNHLRYLFLRKIESLCREQNRCSLLLTPESLGIPKDPCAHVTKFAELAYKCRPNKFINKILCEGNRIRLICNEEDRIVIFSAFFGATAMGASECPGTSTVKSVDFQSANRSLGQLQTQCQSADSTDVAMAMCHGKRSCTIVADMATFGVPECPVEVKNYLKVVYTCTSKKMLKNTIDSVEQPTPLAVSTTTPVPVNRIDVKESMKNRVDVYTKAKVGDPDSLDDDDDDEIAGEEKMTQNETTTLLMDSEIIARGSILSSNTDVNCTGLPPSVQKSAAMRKVRESQLPPTPFEIIDFEDDILDEEMIHPRYRSDSLEIHRQPYGVSSAPNSTAEPRPLLYSTLHRKSKLSGAKYSANYDGSRNSHSNYTPSPLSTLPKSILTNRNSLGGGGGSQNRDLLKSSVFRDSEYGSVTSFNQAKGRKVSPLASDKSNGVKGSAEVEEEEEEEEESTEPRMLSKSLNNFFL